MTFTVLGESGSAAPSPRMWLSAEGDAPLVRVGGGVDPVTLAAGTDIARVDVRRARRLGGRRAVQNPVARLGDRSCLGSGQAFSGQPRAASSHFVRHRGPRRGSWRCSVVPIWSGPARPLGMIFSDLFESGTLADPAVVTSRLDPACFRSPVPSTSTSNHLEKGGTEPGRHPSRHGLSQFTRHLWRVVPASHR